MDRIRQNFVYTLILIRSGLGLLPIIFSKFIKEYLTALDFFSLNILRTNEHNSTYFCMHINTNKILVGIGANF